MSLRTREPGSEALRVVVLASHVCQLLSSLPGLPGVPFLGRYLKFHHARSYRPILLRSVPTGVPAPQKQDFYRRYDDLATGSPIRDNYIGQRFGGYHFRWDFLRNVRKCPLGDLRVGPYVEGFEMRFGFNVRVGLPS
jgi:hypothetical protein